MNAQQLWETTMDPENRMLKQVNIDNAAEADYIFSMLMGEDVELHAASLLKRMQRMQISMHNLNNTFL